MIESPALNFEQNRPLMVEEESFLLNVKFPNLVKHKISKKKKLFLFVNH